MKTAQRKNYFLLALAIVYCIIALIQFFADGILGTQLYFSIAVISVGTTLLESLKSSIKWMRTQKEQRLETDLNFENNRKRTIDVLNRHFGFSELPAPYQKLYNDTKQNIRTLSENKNQRTKTLDLLESIIQFMEVFLILFFGLVTPLLKIPDNLLTAKIIDVLSVFSIAAAFYSLYMNETMAELDEEIQANKNFLNTSSQYLAIIEKLAEIHSPEKVPEGGEKQDDYN